MSYAGLERVIRVAEARSSSGSSHWPGRFQIRSTISGRLARERAEEIAGKSGSVTAGSAACRGVALPPFRLSILT
jgi:hypothetical protein